MEIKIDSLTDQGIGLGCFNGQPIAVPYTVPGDSITVKITDRTGPMWEGIIDEILTPSPHRITPPCPYFTQCGGCQLQHLDALSYNQFKMKQVTDALHQEGVSTPSVVPSFTIDPGTRRRVTFKYAVHRGHVSIGFYRRKSHDLVSIKKCLLVFPAINTLIEHLKELLQELLTRGPLPKKPPGNVAGAIHITWTAEGIDIILEGPFDNLSPHEFESLSHFANNHNIARLSLKPQGGAPEIAYQHHNPGIVVEGITIPTLPDGFLQASPQGEAALTTLLKKALRNSHDLKILELFSGIGTFTLPLTHFGQVTIYEGDRRTVNILNKVASQYKLPLQAFTQDLFKHPLSQDFLDTFDVIVLDPPRLGAIHQIKEMKNLKRVQKIIYIACHGKTFARDGRFLQNQGWKLQELNIVDQFLWSYHTEIFSIWEKC